jgi:polyisoprenoid-binding protein YceI
MRSRLRRRSTYLVGVPLVLVILAVLVVVVGPYVYINYIEGPPPEELAFEPVAKDRSGASAGEPRSLDGAWRVASGSQAGYRVEETLFGQGTTAVGRTAAVEGRFVLAGTVVQSGDFEVDLQTVSSDRAARDREFQGRIMDTARFPMARFRLSAPLTLRRLPADQAAVDVSARGRLTLRGTSKPVNVALAARRNGPQLEVQGSIPVVFADYGIPNPSLGPAQTEDHGTIEFLLVFTRDN